MNANGYVIFDLSEYAAVLNLQDGGWFDSATLELSIGALVERGSNLPGLIAKCAKQITAVTDKARSEGENPKGNKLRARAAALQKLLPAITTEWEGLQTILRRIFVITDGNGDNHFVNQLSTAARRTKDLPTADEITAFSQVAVERGGVKPIVQNGRGLGSAKETGKSPTYRVAVVRSSGSSSKHLQQYIVAADNAAPKQLRQRSQQ